MSETLEPRKVERPFLGRWVVTALALLLRSPVSFGAAVALLAIFSLLGTGMVPARLIDAGWTLVAGSLLLPLFWVVLSLLARRSDRAVGRSELLQHASSRSVWGGGLLPGCLLASAGWLLHWTLWASPFVANFIGSYTWNCLLLIAPLGVCYFPLMALAPGLTVLEACQLSQKASRLNGEWIIVLFVAALSLTADAFARASPGGDIISAAILVFIAVFNYVAYRDIFERRTDYATESVFAFRPRRSLPPATPLPPDGPRPPGRPRPPSGPWVDSACVSLLRELASDMSQPRQACPVRTPRQRPTARTKVCSRTAPPPPPAPPARKRAPPASNCRSHSAPGAHTQRARKPRD